jgi:uncharacterized OB-fold protein
MSTTPWIVHQKISIPFRYTCGPALERFFRALEQRSLLASVCGSCGRRYCPPLSFCGRCWKPIEDYVQLTGQGHLLSYTIVPAPLSELPDVTPPIVLGLMALEGADTHFVHLLRVENPDALRVGARVRVVWSETPGPHIRAISHFRVA